MLAKQTGNVTIVTAPRFIHQAFLQSDTLIEVDNSHVMEVDDRRPRPSVIRGLKFEYFHAFDIPGDVVVARSSLEGGRLAGGAF